MVKKAVSELTTKKFQEIIKKEKGLIVVDFFADWCMPCVIMAPVLESLYEKNKNVTFAKINVDDNSDLAQEYEISSIPCIVFFKEGKEVDRLIGADSEDALQEKINEFRR
jgi:thioredoxin 1